MTTVREELRTKVPLTAIQSALYMLTIELALQNAHGVGGCIEIMREALECVVGAMERGDWDLKGSGTHETTSPGMIASTDALGDLTLPIQQDDLDKAMELLK